MAAPSSLQIMPSGMAISTATSQPSMACGPPRADINSGMVMNGPMPIMLDMFSAVAWSKPKRRTRCGEAAFSVEEWLTLAMSDYFPQLLVDGHERAQRKWDRQPRQGRPEAGRG